MTSCLVARISNPGERFGKPFYISNLGERFGNSHDWFDERDMEQLCTENGAKFRLDLNHEFAKSWRTQS